MRLTHLTLIGLLLGLCLSTQAVAQTTPAAGQGNALQTMLKAHPKATVQYALNGTPSLITNLNTTISGKTDKARAINVIKQWAPAFGLGASDLKVQAVQGAALTTAVRFAQYHGNLPVIGHGLSVTFGKNGQLLSIHSHVATWSFVAKGKITEAQAKLTATQTLFGKSQTKAMPEARAKRVVVANAGKAVEAWMIGLPRTKTMFQPIVFISTTDGKVVGVRDAALR